MNKGLNLIVDDTRKEIIATLNASGLPVSWCALLLKDILNVVNTQSADQIDKERQEYQLGLMREQQQQLEQQAQQEQTQNQQC